jgi:geranylgeranylglycerol-phosphate geranylgeranyltransferase
MWREVVELARVKNIALAAITVPLGAHLGLEGQWDSNSLGLVALQTASVGCFIVAGNIFNDVSDCAIDKVAKPDKPIPSGRISITQAKHLAIEFSLLSLVLMGIGAYLSTDPIAIIAIWSIASILMYTYDMGLQTKKMGFAGNIAISLMVGAVILYGAATIGKVNTPLAFYAAGVAFFANLGREIIKDCEDMESDKDRNTLPMRVGLAKARMFGYVSLLCALIVLYLPHWLGPLEFDQLLFQAPAMLALITTNGPLQKGEDHAAQQRVRVGMLLGLLGFAAAVSM